METQQVKNSSPPVVENMTPVFSFPIKSEIQLPAPLSLPVITKLPVRKAKRTRSTYSPDQLEQLHKRFKTDTHLPLQERCIIGANIGISEHQVKVWFQNRRNKLKKLAKEGLTEEPVRRRKTPKPKMTKTKPVKLENTPLLQYPSTFPYHETRPYVPNQLPTLSTPIPSSTSPSLHSFLALSLPSSPPPCSSW